MATNLVFKTPKDDPYDHELVTVGVAHKHGRGGVVVAQAAERMPELQDASGEALTGAKLKSAAEEFAEARGLEVVSVSDSKLEQLPSETGVAPDRPDARAVAEEAYRVQYLGEEPDEVAVTASEGAASPEIVTETEQEG